MRKRLVLTAALVGALATGAVITVVVGGGTSDRAVPNTPPVTTATVVRTDLSTTVLTEGTLGYAPMNPVVNRMGGTYTALPATGTVINVGQVLYRVDDLPVVLMAGSTPAWRPLFPGMSDGPDVTELQANLIALGDASGLFSEPSGHFDGVTADAVERWQNANGFPENGRITLGQVVFLPGSVLVGAENVIPGQSASPGDVPYQVTTTTRTVTVPLNPSLPSVSVGQTVSIILPTNATTPGKVSAIGPAPPTAGSSSAGSSGGGAASGGSTPSQTLALLTVSPDQPAATGTAIGVSVQVSLTIRSVTGVLAVPVTALLALTGGGYGLEVVGPSGAHHLVGVTTGIYADGRVEISAGGVHVGTKVVVAQ